MLKCEAEALLAGIVLDTKNFTNRTGGRTFEAAAYLRRAGGRHPGRAADVPGGPELHDRPL